MKNLKFFSNFKAFSNVINNYDVCDKSLGPITDNRAFISSPNYPIYTIVLNECTQTISAPRDKVIKLWVASDMQYSNFNNM